MRSRAQRCTMPRVSTRVRLLVLPVIVSAVTAGFAAPASAAESGDRSGDAFTWVAIVGGLLVGLVLLGLVALWLGLLVQALRIPDSQWEKADQSKLVYVLLMAVLGLLGSIVYLLVARPALRRAGAL